MSYKRKLKVTEEEEEEESESESECEHPINEAKKKKKKKWRKNGMDNTPPFMVAIDKKNDVPKKYVTIQPFQGKTYVHFRQYFMKHDDGVLIPTLKGLAFTVAEFDYFVEKIIPRMIPFVEKARKKEMKQDEDE